MGIEFGSIQTGLPKDIVKQIVAAEKIPLEKMTARKEKYVERQKLVDTVAKFFDEIKTDLNKMNTPKGFRELKALFNDEIINVNLDKFVAEPASYQFQVDQMAQKSSAMSSGFEDPNDSYIGVGFIQYILPNGETKDVYIDSEHSSLKGIASVINTNANMGVRATVVNDGTGSNTPWRIILALKETGDEKYAEFPHFYFVDGESDFYLDFDREAHDAEVQLDGFKIELPENKAKDLIAGTSIDLKKAKPGEEFTLQIVEDVDKMSDKLKALVDKINEVLKFIIQQNSLDEKSDTTKTLGGDVSLQTIESRTRTLLMKAVQTASGKTYRLSDLGVTFNKKGILDFDIEKAKSVLSKDYLTVESALVGYTNRDGARVSGIFNDLTEFVNGVTRRPDGILPTKRSGLQSNMDQLNRQIEQRTTVIDKKEQMLKDKFARLEGVINKIKGQGAGLAALAGSAGNDPVQQLNT